MNMNEITYIQCAKCGVKLCKETDSYRFNENGEPICYDCAEGSATDEQEAANNAPEANEVDESTPDTLKTALEK